MSRKWYKNLHTSSIAYIHSFFNNRYFLHNSAGYVAQATEFELRKHWIKL